MNYLAVAVEIGADKFPSTISAGIKASFMKILFFASFSEQFLPGSVLFSAAF